MTLYHGIPFAAPPVNDLRFKPAQRPTRWESLKSTVTVGPQCGQLNAGSKKWSMLLGEEDCLYMSIYVPAQCTPATPCAVMQWIYGGAWIFGSNTEYGEYNPTNLAERHGVIVVAGNYRLDTLGWLALEELAEESATGSYGNYGLSDQRAVMRYIQRNIRLFGGDPNQARTTPS